MKFEPLTLKRIQGRPVVLKLERPGRANEKRQELTLRLPDVKSVVDVGSVELAGE